MLPLPTMQFRITQQAEGRKPKAKPLGVFMDFDTNTDRKPITVQGVTLDAISPYAEGHTLTANEAHVLNQTLAENLRNNFAPAVKAAIKANGEKTDGLDLPALQSKFDEYQKGYSFGIRVGGFVAGDPVAKEAYKIAEGLAKDLLKSKGHKLAGFPADKMDALIAGILEKKPEITELAKKRVEEKKSIGIAGLDF